MMGFARVGTPFCGPREAGQEGLRNMLESEDWVIDLFCSFSPRAPGAELGSVMAERLEFEEAEEAARWAARWARWAEVASEALRATLEARSSLWWWVARALRLGTSMCCGTGGGGMAKPFFSFSL